jgi:hypothetical protein
MNETATQALVTNMPIKLFKGVQAIDGSIQPTMKLALAHSRDVKVKQALIVLAGEVVSAVDENIAVDGVTDDDSGHKVIYITEDGIDLANFLFANRIEIQAAFNQEVRQRKVRAKKAATANSIGLVAA